MTVFPTVWYADHHKITTQNKVMAMSDRGSLSLGNSQATFIGKDTNFEIQNVQDIRLIRQPLPWRNYILVNLPFVLIFVFVCAILGRMILSANDGQIVQALSLTPCVLIFAIFFVGINIFGIAVGASTRWVRIDYQLGNNPSQQAYFADGTNFGWGGIFGGTAKLYQSLLANFRPANEN